MGPCPRKGEMEIEDQPSSPDSLRGRDYGVAREDRPSTLARSGTRTRTRTITIQDCDQIRNAFAPDFALRGFVGHVGQILCLRVGPAPESVRRRTRCRAGRELPIGLKVRSRSRHAPRLMTLQRMYEQAGQQLGLKPRAFRGHDHAGIGYGKQFVKGNRVH